MPTFTVGQQVQVRNTKPEPSKHDEKKHAEWGKYNFHEEILGVREESVLVIDVKSSNKPTMGFITYEIHLQGDYREITPV